MSRFGFGRLLLLLSPILLLMLSATTQRADAQVVDCKDFIVIFARGSGQKMTEQRNETTALRASLGSYLTINNSNFIELDASQMPNDLGLKYDAQAVIGRFDDTVIGAQAVLTRGNIGKYKESVDSGRELLINYLTNSNFLKCGTKIVLAGYSQGAEVISGALFDNRLINYLPQVSYVATFGDPSIDLNSLVGGDWFAQTPWFKGNATKYMSGGIVSRRSPYLPPQIQDKAGAWCLIDDVICTGNAFQFVNEKVNKVHTSQYVLRAIPDAAREIAARLKEDLAIPFTTPMCGALKQDIVIALDVSPSVIGDNYFLGERGIKKVVDGVATAGCDVRVGLVLFGRKNHEATQPIFDLTPADQAPLGTSLAALRAWPKSLTIEKPDILSGLNLAMDMSWREDAQKAVVVMSDAPGDNYKQDFYGFNYDDFVSQTAVQSLLQKSREKGGVEFHAVKIPHNAIQNYVYTPGTISFYQYMSKLITASAGTYIDSERCDFCTWLDMNFSFTTKLAQKPVVSVPNVRVKLGQSISLNARDLSGGVIAAALKRGNSVSYQWFTDCSQKLVPTNNTQQWTFKPTKAGTCHGTVLARVNTGQYCSVCTEGGASEPRAATPFTIEVLPADYTPPPLPGLVRNIKKDHLWNQDTIRIAWDAPANAAEVGELAYVVKDTDGNILGVTSSPQIEITDVPDDDEPTVLVSAASAGGMGGGNSSLDAADISQPKPEVLGVSTADQSTTPPADMQQVLASAQLVSSPSAVFKQIAAPAQSPVAFSTSLQNSANILSQGLIHNMNQAINAPAWLKLTIMAIPIVTAIALGMTIKYALKLRAKEF